MSKNLSTLCKKSSPETEQNSNFERAQRVDAVRLYRLPQVLTRIPVSKSSWFAGIKAGIYPQGLHLGPRTTVWRSDDIDRVIENLGVAA